MCISMITSEARHVILYLLALGVPSSVNSLFTFLVHFSRRLSLSNRLLGVVSIFQLLTHCLLYVLQISLPRCLPEGFKERNDMI